MAGVSVRRAAAVAAPSGGAEETARRGIHDVLDDDVAEVLQKTVVAPEAAIGRAAGAEVRVVMRRARAQEKP